MCPVSPPILPANPNPLLMKDAVVADRVVEIDKEDPLRGMRVPVERVVVALGVAAVADVHPDGEQSF